MRDAHRSRQSWAATAVGLLMALAAAGCGGIGDSGSDGASACSSPGVTSDAVQLGLLFPDTGNIASTFIGFRSGVNARIQVQNHRGGVGGREISFEWQDDGSEIDRNLVSARDLVERQQVFGIIEGSAAERGSARYLADEGIPVTGLGPSMVWNEYPSMFTWTALVAQDHIAGVWGDIARERGGSRAAVLAVTAVPGSRDLAEGIAASMELAGVDVTYKNLDVFPTINLAGLAQDVAESGADVVTGVIIPEMWSEIGPALAAAGADVKIPLFPSGYDHVILERFGPALAGEYIGTVTAPFELDLPAHREYIEAMTAYSPEIQPPQNQLALNGWLAADLMIRGLEVAGSCPTREAFVANLRKVTDYDGGGLIRPPVDLNIPRQPSRCLHVVQVDAAGGAYRPQGAEAVCGQIAPRR